MSNRKSIYCLSCGCKRSNPKAKPGLCQNCYNTSIKLQRQKLQHSRLIELKYEILNPEPEFSKNSKPIYHLKRIECGHEFKMIYPNINKQVAITGITPCPICGADRRMSACLQGYLDKYAKQYDVTEFNDYRQLVRAESRSTYKKFKNIINPLNLKRGHRDYHLDHKVPIKECFIRGISVKVAGSLENLQMLKYDENISKHSRHFCEELAIRLSEYS